MNLTVYGNNATCPEADGACACFLVRAGKKKILLDMGNGCLAKLQKDIDLAELDMIVISHFHFDHFGDLFCAKYQLETRKSYGEQILPIFLLTPQMPDWARSELLTNDVFDYHEIQPGFRFSLENAELSFIPMVHLVESYGVRLCCDEKVFAYSGDTGTCPALDELAENADTILCEATMVASMNREEGHHLCAATAAQTAYKNGVKQLLLTHYHGNIAERILQEAKDIFLKTQLTMIGKTYEV